MTRQKNLWARALLLALVAILALAGCNQPVQEEEPQPVEKMEIRIGALKGPTALGMLQLMDKAEAEETANLYRFTLAGAPDEIRSKLIAGELDLAAVPANLAAVMYNKTEGQIKMAAVNTLGVLYLVEDGETIHSVEDLRGQTIYATGQGSTPEYALNYILEANGLIPGTDVEIVYKAEHSEVAALLAEKQISLAVLPQPFVTSVLNKSETVRTALDLTEEWQKVDASGGSLVMGCLVVRSEFYAEHQEAVEALLQEYAASVAFTNEQVEEAAALSAKYDIIAEAVAKQAIPYCSIVYEDGEAMQTLCDNFFQVLFDANPQSLGGKLPDEAIYLK